MIREKCLCCECKYYHNPVGICEGYDKFPQNDKFIQDIVTHEQFNQMKYIVGG